MFVLWSKEIAVIFTTGSKQRKKIYRNHNHAFNSSLNSSIRMQVPRWQGFLSDLFTAIFPVPRGLLCIVGAQNIFVQRINLNAHSPGSSPRPVASHSASQRSWRKPCNFSMCACARFPSCHNQKLELFSSICLYSIFNVFEFANNDLF